MDTQLLGLDFREIENIVDDEQQVARRMIDGLDILKLLGAWVRVAQQMGDANHPVHWCADFMAHIGQELAFGKGCRLGAFKRNGKVGIHLCHGFIFFNQPQLTAINQAIYGDCNRGGEQHANHKHAPHHEHHRAKNIDVHIGPNDGHEFVIRIEHWRIGTDEGAPFVGIGLLFHLR